MHEDQKKIWENFEKYINENKLTNYILREIYNGIYLCKVYKPIWKINTALKYHSDALKVITTKTPLCAIAEIAVRIDTKDLTVLIKNGYTRKFHSNTHNPLTQLDGFSTCCRGTLPADRSIKFDEIKDYFNNLKKVEDTFRICNFTSPLRIKRISAKNIIKEELYKDVAWSNE